MIPTKASIASVLVLLSLALPGCRTAGLLEPGRITLGTTSAQAMRSAVVGALAARGWMAAEDESSVISATLIRRGHMAKVRVAYDANSYTLGYLDSANLHYRELPDGTKQIHRNYNKWVQILMREIANRVAMQGAGATP